MGLAGGADARGLNAPALRHRHARDAHADAAALSADNGRVSPARHNGPAVKPAILLS